MNSLKNQKICLKEFIPSKVICKNSPEKTFDLNVLDDGIHLMLAYFTDAYNHLGKCGRKEYTLLLPKFIKRNEKTFEVLGLLQAEMGKQHDGKVVFCNHEYRLIKKVIDWFEEEFNISKDSWKWYIKVNINEPSEGSYKKEVEDKVINYWISKMKLSLEQSYPKKVSYIKNTSNTQLRFYDYGNLIIEIGSNLFSQILKNYVKNIFHEILLCTNNEIRWFMKGIIAGESNVEVNQVSKHYRVFISAKNLEERRIYQSCLKRLDVDSTVYPDFHGVVISKKENNLELIKQKLMTLSPEKYNKFLRMMSLYGEFKGLQEWRSNLQKPHNKIPQEKINKITEMHKLHPDWPAWKIAEQVGVSVIKVNRVLKENNFGKRVVKTPESKRKEIAQFAKENLSLTHKKIAEIFNVHESVVRRSITKYKVGRGNKSRCKISEEKIQKIIEIYKQNPTVKFYDVVKEVGISDTALTRIRREYNLIHLGYKHVIGNNNPKMKSIVKIEPLIVEK